MMAVEIERWREGGGQEVVEEVKICVCDATEKRKDTNATKRSFSHFIFVERKAFICLEETKLYNRKNLGPKMLYVLFSMFVCQCD